LKIVREWDGNLYPHYDGERHFDACGALFDIQGDGVVKLFSPESYDYAPTPKQVAKRIRKFVESGHV